MILKLAYQETDPVSDPYWNNMRNHDYNTSFPAVRDFIQQSSQKMRSPNKRRNRITWVLAVLLPLLIFFSCQQKTYIEPQGATIGFIAKDSLQSTLEFAIQQFADKTWKIVMRSHAGTIHGTIYASTDSSSKLKAFVEKLKTITGVTELYFSTMTTAVKESRLSHLTYKIFNRHVYRTGATDEELRSEIESKLKENGLHLKVQLVKESGRKQVELIPRGEIRDFSIDLTLLDGTNVTAIAEKW